MSTASSNPEFTIRPARDDEAGLVLDFIQALAEYEKLGHEVVATEENLKESLFGPRPYAEVIFGCENDVPVGFAIFFHNFSTFLGRPGLYLEDLFVHIDHRGKGYGKALLVELARLAVQRGCGRLDWAVLDWNAPAIGFYESLGAELMTEWRTFRLTGDALNHLAGQTDPD